MTTGSFTHSYASTVDLKTDIQTAFDYLNDPMKLSAHMEKSSMMMGGSAMTTEVDSRKGQELGSIITLKGKFLGIELSVKEHIVELVPPLKKVWQTFGQQKMIIIDRYQMGFFLEELVGKTRLNVFINYVLPAKGVKKILGKLLSRAYAKWCVNQIANDALEVFNRPHRL